VQAARQLPVAMPSRRRRDSSGSASSGRKKRSRSRRRNAKRSRSRRRERRSHSRRRSRSRNSAEKQLPAPVPSALAMPAKAAPAAVPDWLADLMPGGSGAQSTQIAPAKPATTTSQVEIPLSLIGLLTNDNEAPVRRISSDSGAIIQIRQDMQHFGYSLCIITGKPDNIAKATEMVKQHVGLSSGIVTKEIETSADHVSIHGAMDLVRAEMQKRKAGDVAIRILPPDAPGGKVRVCIGPGPVFLVSMAEQLLRKKLSGVELDLCYKQKRPVPIEMKVAVLCKFYEAGSCSLAGGCQYSHGAQELAVVQRAHMPEGAENARGHDPATLVANLPRWPPMPGHIRALAPMQDLPAGVTTDARQASKANFTTSGMI